MAIELCRGKNITLIGFARGNKMNIYSGIKRIDVTECKKNNSYINKF